MECVGQGKDFELIPTVKMETIKPLEAYFLVNFRRSESLRSFVGLKLQDVKNFP